MRRLAFLILALFFSGQAHAQTSLIYPPVAGDVSNATVLRSGSGAAAETAQTSLNRVVYLDQFTPFADGVTDDLPAFNRAKAALVAMGGGFLELGPKRYAFTSGCPSAPSNVIIDGKSLTGMLFNTVDVSTLLYALIVDPTACPAGASFVGNNSTSVGLTNLGAHGINIINKNLLTPTTTRQALTMVAGFSGVGITNQVTSNASFKDVGVFGFGTCFSSYRSHRINIDGLWGDCTAGVAIDNSLDNDRISSVHIFPALTQVQSWTKQAYAISGAVDNGSGLYRLTVPAGHIILAGDTVFVAGVVGSTVLNDRWTVAAVGATTIDLTAAPTAPTPTGVTTTGSTFVSVSSVAGLAAGQTVTGTGIPGGATITQVWPTTLGVTLSAVATATGTGVALTISNPVYVSGGTLTLDTNYRSGDGFAVTNSTSVSLITPMSYMHNVGYHLGTGSANTQILDLTADSDAVAGTGSGSHFGSTSAAILIDGTATGTGLSAGHVYGGYGTALRLNTTDALTTHTVAGGLLLGANTIQIDANQGRLAVLGSSNSGTAVDLVSAAVGKVILVGNDFAFTTLLTQSTAAFNNTVGDGANRFATGSQLPSGGGVANLNLVNTGANAVSAPLAISGTVAGSTDNGAAISLNNTTPGQKFTIRTNASGNFNVLNNAGTAVASITQAGQLLAQGAAGFASSGPVTGTTFSANGTSGVACTGTPTASFASVGGIVTHC